MVEIPHNVLDFADALHLLAQSQSDVSEIVTKWDLICDTTTARTVTVNINGTTMEVDNLAKIRQDLVSGLSLDNPTVTSLKLLERSGGCLARMCSTKVRSSRRISLSALVRHRA